jgi:hypothetical protein
MKLINNELQQMWKDCYLQSVLAGDVYPSIQANNYIRNYKEMLDTDLIMEYSK